jgi:hypothetical protein
MNEVGGVNVGKKSSIIRKLIAWEVSGKLRNKDPISFSLLNF